MSSGCDKGSASSKFSFRHSLCPALLRLKEPEREKTWRNVGNAPEGRRRWAGGSGAPCWRGWGRRAPSCVFRAVTCRGVGGGPSTPPPPLSVRRRARGRGLLIGAPTCTGLWKLSLALGTGSFALAGRSTGSMMTCVTCVRDGCQGGTVAGWSGAQLGGPHPRSLCQVSSWTGCSWRSLPAASRGQCRSSSNRPVQHAPSAGPAPGSGDAAVTPVLPRSPCTCGRRRTRSQNSKQHPRRCQSETGREEV